MTLQKHREQGRGGTRSSPSVLYTDYDNTIIVQNGGVAIVRSYLWSGPGHFFSRLRRVLRLRHILDPRLRDRYNAVLHLVSVRKRHKILAGLRPSVAWLAAVRPLQSRRPMPVIIVSRNCLTVIQEWLSFHEAELREHGIVVTEIVANGPLNDPEWVVRWTRGDGKPGAGEHDAARSGKPHGTVERLAKGPLTVDQKRRYLPKDCVYIGDKYELPLLPFVGKFVRV